MPTIRHWISIRLTEIHSLADGIAATNSQRNDDCIWASLSCRLANHAEKIIVW